MPNQFLYKLTVLFVTDYLTKMGINTVPQIPYSPDLAPCDFCLFPKLRGCRYETIEEMKEALTKVIDTLTQEDFHGALKKLLERYNKCIATGGDYFEGEWSFMSVLSIKVPLRKKSEKLSYAPRIKYMISKDTLYLTFLNEPELMSFFLFFFFFLLVVKWFHLFLPNTNAQLNVKRVLFQSIQFSIITHFSFTHS